nr:hypothetical protein [Tanacetum cinerariifolium]
CSGPTAASCCGWWSQQAGRAARQTHRWPAAAAPSRAPKRASRRAHSWPLAGSLRRRRVLAARDYSMRACGRRSGSRFRARGERWASCGLGALRAHRWVVARARAPKFRRAGASRLRGLCPARAFWAEHRVRKADFTFFYQLHNGHRRDALGEASHPQQVVRLQGCGARHISVAKGALIHQFAILGQRYGGPEHVPALHKLLHAGIAVRKGGYGHAGLGEAA